MKIRLFYVLGSLLLVSCASLPEFKKASAAGGIGYWHETENKELGTFYVYSRLPKKIDDHYRYRRRYTLVAAANVCAENNFKYSDAIDSKLFTADNETETYKTLVFCGNDDKVAILNIEIEPGLKDEQPVLMLLKPTYNESLKDKKTSKFVAGDTIWSINGIRVFEITKLQEIVSKAAKNGKKTVAVELFRAGKKLSIEEPIVEVNWGTENSKVQNIRNL